LQNALAGTPTQAQANAAHVNHFTTVRDSAIANNLPAVARISRMLVAFWRRAATLPRDARHVTGDRMGRMNQFWLAIVFVVSTRKG